MTSYIPTGGETDVDFMVWFMYAKQESIGHSRKQILNYITVGEMVEEYGDFHSDKAFEQRDYTEYPLNCYVGGQDRPPPVC